MTKERDRGVLQEAPTIVRAQIAEKTLVLYRHHG